MRYGRWVLLLLAGCSGTPVSEQTPMEREIRMILMKEAPEARLSLWLGEADGEEILAIDADRPVAGSSMLKILILSEVHAQAQMGLFRWDDLHVLREEDLAEGSGSLVTKPAGTEWSYRELVRRMIVHSDNTAANILLKRLGITRVNARAERLGLETTRLGGECVDRKGVTTAREMGALMGAVMRREILTLKACDAMSALLEATPRTRIAAGVPSELCVGRKGGTLSGMRADAAWVRFPERPYVFVVILDELAERSGVPDRGNAALVELSRHVFRKLSACE